MQTLDDLDRAILSILQQNNRLTTEQISAKVNLSQSAVQRRISRLRKNKVIEADISVISPKALGVGITCIVDVVLIEGNSKAIEDFKNKIKNCHEVTQCYYVTGTYDFVLVVHTEDMLQFENFQKNNLLDNPNLKHFYTHVVMNTVKLQYGIQVR